MLIILISSLAPSYKHNEKKSVANLSIKWSKHNTFHKSFTCVLNKSWSIYYHCPALDSEIPSIYGFQEQFFDKNGASWTGYLESVSVHIGSNINLILSALCCKTCRCWSSSRILHSIQCRSCGIWGQASAFVLFACKLHLPSISPLNCAGGNRSDIIRQWLDACSTLLFYVEFVSVDVDTSWQVLTLCGMTRLHQIQVCGFDIWTTF